MAAQVGRSPGDCATWRVVLATALLGILLAILIGAPNRALATPYAAVVMDARSGEILHARNHDTRLHPASLTKMMTLYVTFEAIGNGEISLDTMVTVSRRAASEVPSRLGLRTGQRIALRYLIRAAALRSGNDAATAIAEAVGGSVEGFAARMTRTAAAIGMENTRFLNAHGLTEVGHYSTARDMTILGRQLQFDYPQYYNLFSRRSEHAGVAHVRNTNVRFLDGYRGADGIKTGFTRAAGYNLTASAERNGVRIIVTVFGGRSVIDRHRRVVELMDMGFARAPARVATRRPAPPDYDGAPQVAGAGGGTRAAGRTIRLQTAPQRSPFPERRPGPAEAVLVALQEEIGAVLAEVAIAPADEVDTSPPQGASDTAETGAVGTEAAVAEALQAPAPEVSPLPVARPVAIAAARTDSEAEGDIASRAATGPTGALGGLSDPEALEEDDAEPPARHAAGTQPGQDSGQALAEILLPGAALDPDIAAEEGVASTDIPGTPAPLASLPVTPPPLQRFDHSAEEIGPVVLRDGLVLIPGLPAIAINPEDLQSADTAAMTDPELQPIGATPVPQPAELLFSAAAESVVLPIAADHADRSLDERLRAEFLPDAAIVLTTSDAAPVASFATSARLPEIVTRSATPYGGNWVVRLGDYPSRFDAERALLRVALSESGTLGRGGRRVGQRGGRFIADIENLTQEQAELACIRLGIRAQPCEVIAP